MARFGRKRTKSVPALNTASLPDIIFMLLFFFMVTTTIKQSKLMVRVKPPHASEAEKLEKKSLVTFIYIGSPLETSLGSEPRIQVNDAFADLSEIAGYIEGERARMPEQDQNQMITSLKVDKDARMGIVTDVKQELRKANALKISYSSLRKSE